MTIKLKQIDLSGMSTGGVIDGALLVGTESAELIAGVDDTQHAQIVATEADGRVKISDGGTPLRISVPSVSNAGNSTSTPLAANAVFTGTPVFVQDFAAIGVFVFANVGSAVDGIKLQWSVDGVLWTETLAFTLLPSIAGSYTVGPRAAWFRLVFTNGGTAQTTLQIQTLLHYTVVRTGTVRISDVTSPESDASTVKAVITGRTTQGGGGYVDVKVAPSGAVAIDGTVTVSNFPASPAGPATAAVASVAASVTSVTLLASNALRRGSTVQNDSADALYLKLGSAASNTSYTCLVQAGAYYETPYGYTGIITGAWASAVGAARVTEVV